MTLRKRKDHVLVIGVFALLALLRPVAAPGQTVVATAKSPKELAGDLEYLIKIAVPAGDPRAETALNVLNQFKSGELVKGLDQSRSFGVAVTLPRDFPQGGPPSVVAAVPVTDLGQFLDSLKNFGLSVDDQPGVQGFSHKVTGPNGNPSLFVLESKGYALFSLVPDGVDKLQALDPSSWRPKGRPDTALSLKVNVSEIPESLKEQVWNNIEARAAQDRERKPGEKDAEYRARLAGQNLVYEAFRSLTRDGEAIALDVELNRKTEEFAINLDVTGRPGTPMAKALRGFSETRSRFAGLGQDAALAAWMKLPVSSELREAVIQGFEKAAASARAKIESPEEKKLHERVAELTKTNLNAPEIDLGLVLRRVSAAGQGEPRFVIVGGIQVKDGREIERLLRDGLAKITLEKGVTVQFDHARSADGTSIHRLSGPYDEKNKNEAELVKRFGKASLFFAFRQDVVLAAFGEDGVAPLSQAIAAASTPPARGSHAPVVLTAHAAHLGELADKPEEREAFHRASAEVFKGDGPKRDRISFLLNGQGDGIRLRLSVDLPTLKLVASAVQASQK